MDRSGFMMRWRMGRRSLGALALLFGLIAGYYPQPVEAQVAFTQITNSTGFVNDLSSVNSDGTRIAIWSSGNLTGGNADGNTEIFLWTQGAGITQITNTTGGVNELPSINSDGTRIAFRSDRNLTGGNADGNYEIFLWSQGSGITQITSSTGGGSAVPSINSDGTRIAFYSYSNLTGGNADGNWEIFLWSQGSGITQITNTTGSGNFLPSINSDGTRIAFYSDRDLTPGSPGNADGNTEIFLWTQGSGITQITNTTGGFFGNTRLSINSNGSRIAFSSDRNLTGGNADGNDEIFLWTQGSGITQITNTTGGGNFSPSINADGTRIAFSSSSDLTPGSPGNADGNEEIFLATLSDAPPPQPVLSISPPSLNFNSVAVGGTKDLSITVTNTSGGTLTGSCTTTAPFSLPNGCSFSLGAGQSQPITVRFSPTSAGIFETTVSFTSNGGSASPTVRGEGKGAEKPHIDFLNLTSGPVGTTVTISGSTFGSQRSTLKFGSKTAKVTSWSDTQIKATVPSLSSGTYDVTVTTKNGSSNAVPFTVTAPPPPSSTISSIVPTSGTVGTVVTIKGKNFGSTQGSSLVNFGSTQATSINSWSNTQIKVVTPSASGTVPVTVTTLAGTSNGDKMFTYVRPPVLVVPGIYGSWSSKLFCSNTNQIGHFETWLAATSLISPEIKGTKIPKKWTIDPILSSYDSLIAALRINGFNAVAVPYDWRQSNTNTASVKTLMVAIDNAKKKHKVAKVDVVAHSMGGLLVRWYLQSSRYRGDIRKFAMVGTPNHGSIDAYYAWEGGNVLGAGTLTEKIGFEFLMERALENMKQGCNQGSISDFMFVQAWMPSVKELLPTFPFLVFPGISEVSQPLACETNILLPYLNQNPSDLTGKDVDLAIFAGTGQTTAGRLSAVAVPFCQPHTKWADGEPVSSQPSSNFSDGDGRVLSSQVILPGVTVVAKPAAHGDLPDAFRNEIVEFLIK